MKRLVISALTAMMTAGAACADPVTVMAPKDPSSPEQAHAYVTELGVAVKKVCAEASGPLYGMNYYRYLSCLKATRADVAKIDPTGLFAARESAGTMIAAR